MILRSYDSRIRAYAMRRFEQISVKPYKCSNNYIFPEQITEIIV